MRRQEALCLKPLSQPARDLHMSGRARVDPVQVVTVAVPALRVHMVQDRALLPRAPYGLPLRGTRSNGVP
jgi:hypothetical protein